MSALKFTQSEKIFNPYSKDFWRQDTQRTTFVRVADAGDDLQRWDVQANQPDEADMHAHRLTAMEAAGFERVVVVQRGPFGCSDFTIEMRHLFIHREARIKDDERTARMLMCFYERNYLLPEFRHLSAFKTWFRGGPEGLTLDEMHARARPMKREIEQLIQEEAERALETQNEPLSDDEEREIIASDARLATILKKKGRLGLLSQKVVRKRLSAARGRHEERRAALDGWRRDNIISLTRWRDQRLAGGDALLPAAEPFFFDKRRPLPDLSPLKFTRAPAPFHTDYDDTPPSQEDEGAKSKIADHGFIMDGDAPLVSPPMLVKNLLPKAGIAFLGGQSGAGKTFVAVDLAVALCAQQPFFGYPVRERVGVAILAGEGSFTIGDRIRAAKLKRNIDENIPVAHLGAVPNLLAPVAIKEMVSRLQALDAEFKRRHGVRLGVVILDTMAATFAIDDENDNAKAQRVIAVLKIIADSLGVVAMPVHHFGKGQETGLRGASAFQAGADVVIAVNADQDRATGHVSNRRLNLVKSRTAEGGWSSPFNLRPHAFGSDEDGDPIIVCSVDDGGELQPTSAESQGVRMTRPLSGGAAAYRKALWNVLAAQGVEVRPFGSEGPKVRAVDREAVRAEFYATQPADGKDAKSIADAKRKAFRRAEEVLTARSIITVREVSEVTLVWLATPLSDSP